MTAYGAIEAALLDRLRAYQGGGVFDAANSSRGDYGVMDARGTPISAVVVQARDSRYGDDVGQRRAQGKRGALHAPAIDLFVSRGQGQGGEAAAYETMVTLGDGIVAYLDQHPTLGGVVERIAVIGRTRPLLLDKRPHVFVRLSLEATTADAITLAAGEHL